MPYFIQSKNTSGTQKHSFLKQILKEVNIRIGKNTI